MKRFMTKKAAAIGIAASLLVGGGVAFAVIGLQGTGTGSQTISSGTTGTAQITLSVHINNTPALIPGSSAVISFDASNPNPNPVTVSTISLRSVTSSNATCNDVLQNLDPNQISMATVSENELIPANTANYIFPHSSTIVWRNDDGTGGTPIVDQSSCLGVPLTVTVQTP